MTGFAYYTTPAQKIASTSRRRKKNVTTPTRKSLRNHGHFQTSYGKEHDPNRKLIALQVLSKHLETSGTGPPCLTQAIRLPNKSWTLLHDTVVEVIESWKCQIRTEFNLIQ